MMLDNAFSKVLRSILLCAIILFVTQLHVVVMCGKCFRGLVFITLHFLCNYKWAK
jgi:hypothetical protein